jgi:hypothetical protein
VASESYSEKGIWFANIVQHSTWLGVEGMAGVSASIYTHLLRAPRNEEFHKMLF